MTQQQVENAKSNAQDAQRWRAVQARDAAQDRQFVYSVKSTGVFCRPSCPSRQALRRNVAFHDNPAQARAAGFRPCKRCKPESPNGAHPHADRIISACRQIEAAEAFPGLDLLAADSGLSNSGFQRAFRQQIGLTPRQYFAAVREVRLRGELQQGSEITAALYAAGYGSSGRFYEAADRVLGMKPGSYRAGGEQLQVHFALGECSLGSILVAESERGICAIFLGDEPEQLLQDLQDQFSRAELMPGDSGFDERVARVVGFIDEPGTGLDLPLDIRGTAFQKRVWDALSRIPCGETASYSEIAQMLGSPRAVRAVAGACAANKLAIAIPCHRVVRSDGSLSGYRWGVERKRQLLRREARS